LPEIAGEKNQPDLQAHYQSPVNQRKNRSFVKELSKPV